MTEVNGDRIIEPVLEANGDQVAELLQLMEQFDPTSLEAVLVALPSPLQHRVAPYVVEGQLFTPSMKAPPKLDKPTVHLHNLGTIRLTAPVAPEHQYERIRWNGFTPDFVTITYQPFYPVPGVSDDRHRSLFIEQYNAMAFTARNGYQESEWIFNARQWDEFEHRTISNTPSLELPTTSELIRLHNAENDDVGGFDHLRATKQERWVGSGEIEALNQLFRSLIAQASVPMLDR